MKGRVDWRLPGIVVLGLIGFLFLREAFAGRLTLNPIALSFGTLEMHWYGLIIAGSLALAFPWAMHRARQRQIQLHDAEIVFMLAILGAILGARSVYIVQNLPYYTAHLGEILNLTTGGLSIHGALFGGLVAGALIAKKHSLPFWKLSDAAMPALLLGMILGRFGNFTNGELFGPPTNLPWKMFVPLFARPPELVDVQFFHPSFLYDAMLNAFVLILLLKSERKMRFSGELTLWFFVGISVTRFGVEFFRLGELSSIHLTSAQLISILLSLVALTLIVLTRRKAKTSL
ncbi:prolipoprotein diacylglyceryl transferase [Candidatus Berkelbacteria bacterium]|nr:prolipoprotein diacylglyceryl transferase [Candidatus Berkelbacteria bacterium]